MTSSGPWVSHAMYDASLILMMTHDLCEENPDRSIAAERTLKKGGALIAEDCPNKIWADPENDVYGALPDLFLVQGHFVVSARAADVLRGFDLGGGALHHVRDGAYQSDLIRRIPGEFFSWVPGNVKDAFLPDETHRKRPFGVAGLRWGLPVLPEDDDIAVSPSALAGPDVWMDLKLFKSIFVSGRLGAALATAGMTNAFCLTKCRVL